MPILHGNPLNGNPAAEEGDHEPAQNLRQTIYDSAKLNLDESTNDLHRSVRQWGIDEAEVVDKILGTLEVAIQEVNTIATKVKVADEQIEEAANRIGGDERAELSLAFQAQHSVNMELLSFLNRIKYTTFLTIEHDINLNHNKAETKRIEFKAHIDAVNDVSEIMSGDLIRRATKESLARRNAAAVRAAIEKFMRQFIQAIFGLSLIILLLIYYQIIPTFIIIYIARFIITAVGGDL